MPVLILATDTASPVEHGSTRKPLGVAYVITNRTNGKKYVGITGQNPRVRWRAHKSRARLGDDEPLYRSMIKHGVDKFSFEVVASAMSYDDLCSLEQIIIAQMGSFWVHGRGYNLTMAGDGQTGRLHSAETRAKMSASRRRKPHSERHRVAMSGRPMHPNSRAAVLAANLGRPKSPEHMLKLRQGRLAYAATDEHRRKLSEAGKRHGAALAERNRAMFTGRPLAPEHIEKLRAARRGIRPSDACVAASAAARRNADHTKLPGVRAVVTPDGVFASSALAAEHFGISKMTARSRARRGNKGWRFA